MNSARFAAVAVLVFAFSAVFFGDKEGNAGDSHLMFWFPQGEHMDWGADASDSPVNVHQYTPQPITEFTISVAKWSDGTVASAYQR